MTKLAGFSGKEVIRKLSKLGYIVLRQKGSHVRLAHPDLFRQKITVPLHKEIGVGLLEKILRDVGCSVDEFLLL